MFKRAFDEDLPISWYLYQEAQTGRCRVAQFLEERPAKDRDKVLARMKAWARSGKWILNGGYVKPLDLSAKIAKKATLYEVKSFQDRIFFIRCGNDAIAIDAIVKKNNWSKKDQRSLEAAAEIAEAAMKECRGG